MTFRSHFLALSFLLLCLYGCGEDTAGTDGYTEPDELGTNASIIRMPVSDDGVRDTVNVARMDFAETTFGFGTTKAGSVIEHEFTFTNSGRVPLLITDTRSTCGCTVADFPRNPVPPGETGAISVRFDTQNKNGHQQKPISIIANTFPAETTLFVSGIVHPE